ncbi:hypothetical protein MASR2M18_02920 [Ignavibacteria bacterium]
MEGQIEIGSSLQYIHTAKFLSGDSPADDFLNNYHSSYLYNRFGYGVTPRLTLSVETGYWFDKAEVALGSNEIISSYGIGDLIIFPRYLVYRNTSENNTRDEIAVGLGMKIPLGQYNDSLLKIEPFSNTEYYIKKPPAVQPTTGAQDFMFYGFYRHGYPDDNLNFATSALYIRKGWNPRGEKTGDFMSVALFASSMLTDDLGATVQIRGEVMGKTDINKTVLFYAYPNYDHKATGSKKLILAPQFNYTLWNKLTAFCLFELPLYQYVEKTQIASQYLANIGFVYRFSTSGAAGEDED